MRKLIIVSLLLFIGVSGYSQTLEYTYDKAGNRTSRYVLTLGNSSGLTEKSAIITQNLEELEISIYPNPTVGNLQIVIGNGEEDENYTLLLYSVSGDLLIKNELNGRGVHLINMSTFDPGIYILKLQTTSGNVEYKIIKE